MTRLMEDYSEVVVLAGQNPLEFVDLAVFVAPVPRPGRTLPVRRKRDRAKKERARAAAVERMLRRPDGAAELLEQFIGGPFVELARKRPALLEEARAKMLLAVEKARAAPAPHPTGRPAGGSRRPHSRGSIRSGARPAARWTLPPRRSERGYGDRGRRSPP
jgi:hypothetical protein